MSYKVLIKVYDDPKYYPNGIALATHEEAESYGLNKIAAWTLAENYRVVESDEPVNYQWTSAGLKAVEAKKPEDEV